jgi:PPOX class probable F420-dependent enzyme
VLNLSAEAAAALAERLRTESVAWVTTVTPGGQPQSSPVWFLWEEDEFLVYAQPHSRKVRSIRAHPQVSLHLNSDAEGGQVVTFEGLARIAEGSPLAHEVAAYLAKYRAGIAGIGMSPEQLGAEYSTALRITPTRLRVY